MAKTTKPKKEDRRGKHTKASREKRRLENQRFYDSITSVLCCADCSGSNLIPTDEGDANVCTDCGLVATGRLIEGTTDVLLDFTGSLPYKQRNYFAERLQQARNREPRFTPAKEAKISLVWSMLHDRDGSTWTNAARSFSKYRFRQICGLLNEVEPRERWKQQLERWWQARAIIYGKDNTWPTLDDYHTLMLKILFDPFACYFSLHFKENSTGKHNIPKLDLVFLVLLYNISEEAVIKYGWYFLSKNIIWPTRSTCIHYDRIKDIALRCNADFMKKTKKPNVRSQSYAWLHKHKYSVPDLDWLVTLAMESHQGKIVHNQLCLYDDPLYNTKILLL